MNTRAWALAVLGLAANAAVARSQTVAPLGEKFDLGGSGITGTLGTTVTGGLTVRTNNPDPRLVGSSFGSNGKPKGGIAQADADDDGDLNYHKGSVANAPIKLFSRLKLDYKNYSVVLSTRAFVDPSLETKDVPQGNPPNQNRFGAPLSDRGFFQLNKFANIVPWEAYATGAWPVGHGDLQLSVGREALNWSKALFFIDASHISPLDVTALNQPGVLTDREVDIPVGVINAKYKLKGGLEIEGFYQFEQRQDNLPACGTFFSNVDLGIDPSCSGVVGNVFSGLDAQALPPAAAIFDSDGFSLANGYVLPRTRDMSSGQAKQGGVALRYHFAPSNIDVGAYFLNLESRVPIVDAHLNINGGPSSAVVAALLALGAPASYAETISFVQNIGYNFDFPGNIRTLGVNATANVLGWKTSGEVEYTDNLPVQINTDDLLNAVVGAGGPSARRLRPGVDSFLQGYDRLQNVKIDVSTLRIIPSVLHAKALVLLAEMQFQNLPNLQPLSDTRYGRNFLYGYGTNGLAGCLHTLSPNADLSSGCFNQGYITSNAFGYRLRSELVYEFGGLELSPSLLWTHDVSGYSADSFIIKNRRILTAGVEWKLNKRFFGGTTYTHELNASTFDTLKDRDDVKVYAGVNF